MIYTVSDGQNAWEIDAPSPEAAAFLSACEDRDATGETSEPIPYWYDYGVIDPMLGEHRHIYGVLQPEEPSCVDEEEHFWERVSAWSHGEGLRITRQCDKCGLSRVDDTSDIHPANGSEGWLTTSYRLPGPE